MNVYQRAWELLLERLQTKTGWGRQDLKDLMLHCLIEAGQPTPHVVIEAAPGFNKPMPPSAGGA